MTEVGNGRVLVWHTVLSPNIYMRTRGCHKEDTAVPVSHQISSEHVNQWILALQPCCKDLTSEFPGPWSPIFTVTEQTS